MGADPKVVCAQVRALAEASDEATDSMREYGIVLGEMKNENRT